MFPLPLSILFYPSSKGVMSLPLHNMVVNKQCLNLFLPSRVFLAYILITPKETKSLGQGLSHKEGLSFHSHSHCRRRRRWWWHTYIHRWHHQGQWQPDTAYANVAVSTGDTVRFKLDTGAQVNIMPSSVYTRLRQKIPLQPSTSKLFGYTGKQLTVHGSITPDIMPSSVYTRLRQKIPLQPSASKLFGYTGKQLTIQGSITLDFIQKAQLQRRLSHCQYSCLLPAHTRPKSLSPAGAHQDDPVHRLLHPYDPRQRH